MRHTPGATWRSPHCSSRLRSTCKIDRCNHFTGPLNCVGGVGCHENTLSHMTTHCTPTFQAPNLCVHMQCSGTLPAAPCCRRTMSDSGGEEAAASSVVDINVQEPWFTAIASGRKTVEGRLNRGRFASMAPGTQLSISRAPTSRPSGGEAPPPAADTEEQQPAAVAAVVRCVARYSSFEEYLTREGLAVTLPGVHTVAEGVAVYRQFYSEADEVQCGVAAVHIQLVQ